MIVNPNGAIVVNGCVYSDRCSDIIRCSRFKIFDMEHIFIVIEEGCYMFEVTDVLGRHSLTLQGHCADGLRAASDREGARVHVGGDVGLLVIKQLTYLIHNGRVDKRAVAADPDEPIKFVLAGTGKALPATSSTDPRKTSRSAPCA